MKPKTFQIRLRQPFGFFTTHAYIFHLHVQDREQALAWVERVFVGVNTKPTIYRWSGGAVSPIGNSDPVSIRDCDHFSRAKPKSGALDRPAKVLGEFRVSADEVANELERIVAMMSEEHHGFVSSFLSMSKDYARQPQAWVYKRLGEIKAAAERSALWRDSLSQQLVHMRQPLDLVMPDMAHEIAA